MINDLIIIVILILFSAFFSGTETAMFSLGSGRHFKLDSKNASLNKLKELLKKPDLLLSVILLGNLTVNIAFSHFAHNFLHRNFPLLQSDIINLVVITITLLTTGEILPKVLALRNADKWSLKSARAIDLWLKITTVLAIPLNKVTGFITNVIPEIKHKYNEAELLDTLRFAYKDNIIHENEFKVLQRTIHFYHDTGYNIMIPKSNVTMLPSSANFNSAKKNFMQKKTNFALVFNEKDNKIMGYVSARAIIPFLVSKKMSLNHVMQPIIFLPETLLLNEILEELIKNHLEVAAIIDEMGELSGVITMKDIYHTLLGSFEEEPVIDKTMIKADIYKVKKGIFKLSGQTTLHEFNEFFNSDLVSEYSETISGFLIEKLDGFPQKNTIIAYKNFKFYNMTVDKNMIKSTLMRLENES